MEGTMTQESNGVRDNVSTDNMGAVASKWESGQWPSSVRVGLSSGVDANQ